MPRVSAYNSKLLLAISYSKLRQIKYIMTIVNPLEQRSG